MPEPTTEPTTPPASGVNPTPGTPSGVNPAQSPTDQIVNTSALIANYEGRIRSLMSDKDKALNERNQAISNLTTIQSQLTTLQEQTSGSLTAAANSAQQAIDRARQMEQDLTLERAKNVKLTALMQRPHLAPYADLIPAQGDAATITAALDQLEQIRQTDLDRYTKQNPSLAPAPQQPTTPSPQSILASLYGNRANMNPALFQQTTPAIPASSPAQMSPDYSNDPAKAVEALFAEARRVGTTAAFEDARTKAIALNNSLLSR
jgi:hypothetical protein